MMKISRHAVAYLYKNLLAVVLSEKKNKGNILCFFPPFMYHECRYENTTIPISNARELKTSTNSIIRHSIFTSATKF